MNGIKFPTFERSIKIERELEQWEEDDEIEALKTHRERAERAVDEAFESDRSFISIRLL